MILGMGKRRISQILVTETFSIGLISLVIGLGFGIVLSQGLSIFTARLFNLSLSQYIFSIVTKASEITTPLFLGGMGTFLFFFGISGFLLYVIKKNKNIYLKGLNIFVVKQISSKINTNFISISIISLMLFITIVSLSAGLGLKNVLEKNFEATTPFDATLQLVSQNNKETISEALQKNNISLPKDFKTVAYNTMIVN